MLGCLVNFFKGSVWKGISQEKRGNGYLRLGEQFITSLRA